MTNSFDVKIITVPLPAADWGGDVACPILRAPDAEDGGGLTILSAYAVNGAATTSSTAFALALHNYGTAGTAIKAGAAGTVAAPIGGTADTFAAGAPKAFTISNAFLAAGEWLALVKTEEGDSDPTRGVVVLSYVMGK